MSPRTTDIFGERRAPKTEAELDSIVSAIKERESGSLPGARGNQPGRIQTLRKLMLEELIPVFVELVEKYSSAGFTLQMDASNFLEGGREIRFEFGIGDSRTDLLGTITTEAIAFHETRYNPNVQGELISGPMLRLHTLDAETFRNFVCERLLVLARANMRAR